MYLVNILNLPSYFLRKFIPLIHSFISTLKSKSLSFMVWVNFRYLNVLKLTSSGDLHYVVYHTSNIISVTTLEICALEQKEMVFFVISAEHLRWTVSFIVDFNYINVFNYLFREFVDLWPFMIFLLFTVKLLTIFP